MPSWHGLPRRRVRGGAGTMQQTIQGQAQVQFFLIAALAVSSACASAERVQSTPPEPERARQRMVQQHLKGRDITDQRVLDAMAEVPRHELVPLSQRDSAYADHPLPIGHGQTISQPYIVALMTQLAQPQPEDKALEVGTGSGYQAAVLAELVNHVYTIEIVPELAERARRDLHRLGYANVTVRQGDGYQGWPDQAPFDLIVVTAAPEKIPQPLLQQLADGGRLVIPVGPVGGIQYLKVVERHGDRFNESNVIPVRFVPMTGEAQRR